MTVQIVSNNNDILNLKMELKKFQEKIAEEKKNKIILNNDSYNTEASYIWFSFFSDIENMSSQIDLLQKQIKVYCSKNLSNLKIQNY